MVNKVVTCVTVVSNKEAAMAESQEFERIMALQRKLMGQRDVAKRELEEIDHQLQAVSLTLELLRKDGSSKAVTVTSEQEILTELRTKKTQVPALVAIARHNGGILLTKDAKHLLQRAGLMKATKNASNILYNVINRSERFDHIGSGRYRLKATSNVVPAGTPTAAMSIGLFPKPPVQ
jgi:hypothetical protein